MWCVYSVYVGSHGVYSVWEWCGVWGACVGYMCVCGICWVMHVGDEVCGVCWVTCGVCILYVCGDMWGVCVGWHVVCGG